MHRFFISSTQIDDRQAALGGVELEHLRRVLRLAVGDEVVLFDDRQREHRARICRLSAVSAELEIVASYEPHRESPVELTLACGLTKSDKLDFVVEKATELGVHTVQPFTSSFAVPKLDEKKIAQRTERWQKIALSAAKQSNRTRVPAVLPLVSFEQLIAQAQSATVKVLFWEQETGLSLSDIHWRERAARQILFVVGPEGGFHPDEVSAARAGGFHIVHLGPRILRAETAALTVLALGQFLWGDLGAERIGA